jgi:DNA-binding NarL/FixJ family response regulator
MKKLRVLLADDHRMFLAGLRQLLEPAFDVVDAVEDGRALLAAAAKWKPDVIVADISMPLLNGIDAARALAAEGCAARLIFLTMHGDALYLRQALSAGASDYILKRDAPDKLLAAIRKAAKQEPRPSPVPVTRPPGRSFPKSDLADEKLGQITPRQRQIWQLLAEGRAPKEIAWMIHLSVRTVEFHKYRLMKRLGIRTSAELAAMAIRHGLTV